MEHGAAGDGSAERGERSRSQPRRSPISDLQPPISDLLAPCSPRSQPPSVQALERPALTEAGATTAGFFTPYLGPRFTDRGDLEIPRAPAKSGLSEAGCQLSEISDDHTLCHRTARAIADGKSSAGSRVGWNGARAPSGNRSILGDPRRADMKDILNAKIKRRESFRPFAPSILREHVADWFEQDDDVPYMMEVFQIREEKRSLLPAVLPRRRVRSPPDRSPRDQSSLPSSNF